MLVSALSTMLAHPGVPAMVQLSTVPAEVLRRYPEIYLCIPLNCKLVYYSLKKNPLSFHYF